MMPRTLARNGITTRKTVTRLALIWKAIVVAQISMTGARTKIRRIIMKAVWTFDTSVVSRMTKDEVLK